MYIYVLYTLLSQWRDTQALMVTISTLWRGLHHAVTHKNVLSRFLNDVWITDADIEKVTPRKLPTSQLTDASRVKEEGIFRRSAMQMIRSAQG